MSTNEIVEYAVKVHEKFPQIAVVEIVKIWCEQRGVDFSETEFFNTYLRNIFITDVVNLF